MINIIIPIYNVEKYLIRCLDSLINQSSNNFKAILVDDGSTDGCGKICDYYCERDSRFVVLHKTNGGLVSAVKYGIKNSPPCDYFMFLDGDDFLEEKAVSVIEDAIERFNTDIIMYDFILDYDSGKKVISSSELKEGVYKGESLEILKGNYQKNDNIVPARWNKILKKEIVMDNLKFYKENVSVAEDMLFTTVNFFESKSMVYVKEALIHYCQNSSSMMHNYKNHYYSSYKEVRETLISYFESDEIPNRIFFQNLKTLIQQLANCEKIKTKKDEFNLILNNDYTRSFLNEFSPVGLKNKIIHYLMKKRKYKLITIFSKLNNH